MRRAVLISLVAALLVATPGTTLAAPKPRLGHTVVVKPESGRVGVRLPGKNWVRLREKKAIPLSSEVDTSHGTVKLVSARSARRTQSGTFSRGRFKVTQHSDGLTDLTLTGGDFGVCRAARAAGRRVTGAANVRRRLFGRAHGRFRTRGRNSSATVRGTVWNTEDACDGTSTSSKAGKVATQSRELHFDLNPGDTVTYFCNHRTLEPDSYCVVVLARPAQGLLGAGIITQADVGDYQLCALRPDGQNLCAPFPLSGDLANSFRLSAVVCPVYGPGVYTTTWVVNGVVLFPPISQTMNVAGPNQACLHQP